MKRSICIHGHFYQPPRANPWTGKIPIQPSAAPFPNWNARIFAECYGPNSAARLLDDKGNLRKTYNNFHRLSFDMGPTLLRWMKRYEPNFVGGLQRINKESQSRLEAGNAMAQAYSHAILPLCDKKDLETEVTWGIADYHHHFGSQPQGMWLPETAVSIDVLECLAAQGLKYTILAPSQAKQITSPQGKTTILRSEHDLPTHRPYRCKLPSGNDISIFFYNGKLSHEVAFGGLLENGDRFADSLQSEFIETEEPQMVLLATDGESYGHHHRYGEMALARCFEKLSQASVEVENCASFLRKNPPTWSVTLHENSSWSCAHGIERWKNHCGCAINPSQGWSQSWRGPLREALVVLRDRIREVSLDKTHGLLDDFWAARNDFIHVLGNHSPTATADFFEKHQQKQLSDDEVETCLRAMELQHLSLASFTSCAWFFDDIAGIEATHNLTIAKKAIELASHHFDFAVPKEFWDYLSEANSNDVEKEHGRKVFDQIKSPRVTETGPRSLSHLPSYSAKLPSERRLAGILMHISSLRGPEGIGTLGDEAFRFAEACKDSGAQVWQVLPLVPSDSSGSPYNSWSSFSGNPLLISIENLQREGLLGTYDKHFFNESWVDYGDVERWKKPLLQAAASNLHEQTSHPWNQELKAFIDENPWLEDAADFYVLKQEYKTAWWEWPKDYKNMDNENKKQFRQAFTKQRKDFMTFQFIFEKQWQDLRTYCHHLGISIFGDIPIYVSADSVDVWSHQELFHLDANGKPTMVAGVPPDAFSDDGQLWGNPIYRWDVMKQQQYQWWEARTRRSLQLYDFIRLDHFRAFSAYWEIPSHAKTATQGVWKQGPGSDFFSTLQKKLGYLPFFAEDLGIIDQDVVQLRDQFQLAGMKVLQFGYDGNPKNVHLPYNHPMNSVVYTGTHDNHTTLGWWKTLDDETKHRVRFALGVDGHDIAWDLIRSALFSHAKWAIVPLQDLLKLDENHRMNTPGTQQGNWEWRCPTQAFTDDTKARFRNLINASGRTNA